VLQWCAWMEWAGGGNWEGYVDSLAARGKNGALKSLGSQGKLYSQDWEWQGEHWKIARYVPVSSAGSRVTPVQ